MILHSSIESLSRDPQAALIVVDMQPDFYSSGALPVQGGEQIVEDVGKWMNEFQALVCTQDSHPRAHISFASTYGMKPYEFLSSENLEQAAAASSFSTDELSEYLLAVPEGRQILWPDHCVQATPGWTLDPDLPLHKADLILRKGTRKSADSYSGFYENDGKSTGLAAWLRDRDIQKLMICGLAGDYCVLWTIEDARKEGFEVWFSAELTRFVGFPEGSREQALSKMKSLGVHFV